MVEQLIPVFRVANGRAAADWYRRIGFEVEGEHRFAPELPLYLFLERDGVSLHLSEHTGDAPPGSLAYMWVDDVDALAREVDAVVTEQPWGREIEVTDPDGNRLRIASPS